MKHLLWALMALLFTLPVHAQSYITAPYRAEINGNYTVPAIGFHWAKDTSSGRSIWNSDTFVSDAAKILWILPEQDTVLPELPAGVIRVTVTKIYDGDGCTVRMADGSLVKIRFPEVDAPEIGNSYTWKTQPYAFASRDSLRKWMPVGSQIYIDPYPYGPKKRYTYGRLIADPYGDDSVIITLRMVKAGTVWYRGKDIRRANPEISWKLKSEHQSAKERQAGIWERTEKVGRPLTPWWWRNKYHWTKKK